MNEKTKIYEMYIYDNQNNPIFGPIEVEAEFYEKACEYAWDNCISNFYCDGNEVDI